MRDILTRAAAISAAAAVWAASPEAVAACEMCWGAQVDNPTTQGISMAMLLLVGVTSMVGGGIGAFFYHMNRRSNLLEPGEMVVTEEGDVRHSLMDSD